MPPKGKRKNPVIDTMNFLSNEPMISQIPSQSQNPQNYPSQQISVLFFNLGLSLESQNFLNNIWSAFLFGKQKQAKRALSDLGI